MISQHTLLIGTTGMLYDAAVWLAHRSARCSAFGRNTQRLRSLAEHAPSTVATFESDYTHPAFLDTLRTHTAQHAPIDRALLWIHQSKSPSLLQTLCDHLDHQTPDGHICNISVVLSSTAADPSKNTLVQLREALGRYASLRVQYILLGFIDEGETARWLSHQEISSGVIQAVSSGVDLHVVGTVEPWERRP